MILDQIEQRISDMKELNRRQTISEENKRRNNVDSDYHSTVNNITTLCEIVDFANLNLGFIISDELRLQILDLLNSMKDLTSSGDVDNYLLKNCKKEIFCIENKLKEEWGKHFLPYTQGTLNTLQVISGIDSDKVKKCTSKIKAAENWPRDISVFCELQNAMTDAQHLIQSLDMNNEAIKFLTKMTMGKATMTDLNDDVLAWIKRESLEEKIKLSF